MRSEGSVRTDVFFLKFTSQVALDVESDQLTIGRDSGKVLTLTKVVFPVPPSPTADMYRMS
jgi:hypothetical protein